MPRRDRSKFRALRSWSGRGESGRSFHQNITLMLNVTEALQAIVSAVIVGPAVRVCVDDALGHVLAETIVSEIDSPPFDKALMDGFAVRTADLAGREGEWTVAELTVVDEVTAGRMPKVEVGPGQATRIMTGAPVPAGADAVIPVEETQSTPSSGPNGAEVVSIRCSTSPRPGQFILRRGAAVSRGVQVMTPGRVLRAQEVAALAELGHAEVSVVRWPRVAILATGDELVPASQFPGPGQIRNSNEPMLAAQVQQRGGEAVRLGIARDERQHLGERIAAGLECDFLLLSGGVSAGKLDLVPSTLAAHGVRQIFHKIQMKPGKPLWFGMLERPDGGRPCFVFGLPGNPVSSMVCCELFVGAALRRWCGLEPAIVEPITARLSTAITSSSNRPTYHPAAIEWTSQGPTVTLVDWIGSSDVCATVDANGVALLPAGDHHFAAGALLGVFFWP